MTGAGTLRPRLHALATPLAEIAETPDLLRYWSGQMLSGIGSQATMFVLMTTVYLETGSLTQFALLFALDSLPGVLLAPVAGTLVDRFDRRILHIVGDGGVAIVTTAALVLWSTDSLTVPAIYTLMLIAATFEVVQGAASEAMYQQLVPPSKLVRVGAVFGVTDELTEVIAPAIGVAILVVANAGVVFALDLITFLFALWTLFTFVDPDRFRSHLSANSNDGDTDEDEDEDEQDNELSGLRTFLEGAHYLRREPGMRFVFFYSIVDVFLASFVLLIAATAALELGGEGSLAWVQGAAGAGAVVGMLLIAVLGLRHGKFITRNAVGPGLAIGLALLAVPFSGSVVVLAGAAFLFMLLSAPLDAAMEATYLVSVPKELIGRVSAVFDTFEGIGNLIVLLVLAPIVDRLIVPEVASNGVDLGFLGQIGGDGEVLDGLLLVLGAAGLGTLLLNIAALISRSRSDADQLALALDTPPTASAHATRSQEKTT